MTAPRRRLQTPHDASVAGLPKSAELSAYEKAIIRTTAGIDIGLRTVAATLLASTLAPTVVRRGALGREIERVEFYGDLAERHDSALSFPRPESTPTIRRRRVKPGARAFSVAGAEVITYASEFEPINPELRPRWRSFRNNNVVRAQHWRHPDGPRPTLIVLHGFFASTNLFNSVFLQLPWFYKAGLDVVLFTLPFHGGRAEPLSPYSGYGYFANGTGGFVEATGQAVHDLRVLIDHLESTGVDRVGITGISLGGYTSALLAAVEPRLTISMPNVPVVDISLLLGSWFPASVLLKAGLRVTGRNFDDFARGLAYASPLNYAPVVPPEGRMIITGLGDRLAPPEQSAALWEHWDRCALHWFPGNHLMHVTQPDYLRRMMRFMREAEFVGRTPTG